MKAKPETTIAIGSGDVFIDLCFSPAESRNLQLRSRMMTALRRFIEKEDLTLDPGRCREALEYESAEMSDLTLGKISRFSLDTLVNMLTDADPEVDV